MSEVKQYTVDLQTLFIQFMLTDPELYTRVRSIAKAEYFDRSLKSVVNQIITHTEKYSAMPSTEIIKADTGHDLSLLADITQHSDWFVDEFETFCRHKAIEKAIIDSADLLETGKYGEVESRIKEAVQIGLARSLGTDFFADPRGTLEALRSNNGQITTGWAALDAKLFGGISKGELTVFAGGSGAGKSLFMQNMSLNWAEMGLNCVYFTLELSEGLSCMRMYAMGTDRGTKDIFKDLDEVELKVKMKAKKSGALRVKYLPSGSNVNDFRSYIKELQIQTGIKVDCICVDYLDLLMPATKKVPASDLYIKDKYVSEELRNLAMELGVVMVTASQLNRCLSLDTKVISNGKEMEIKDVRVGDWLESNEGPVQIYEKLPVSNQPVYKIKTKSGKEIVCSGNHKFPVSGTLKTINSGLKVGDILRSIGNSKKMSNLFEIDDEIVEIEYLGEQETIDVNTTGNRLFYANGILTHNSAVEEVEFDHSHIAGGISKIQTADNVIGIFTSTSMRERGQYQLQLLKTRSSNGVGSKVNLLFNVDSLRITDDTTGSTSFNTTATTSSIVDKLRKNTVVNKAIDNDTSDTGGEKTDAAIALRKMITTKTRSAFDEN